MKKLLLALALVSVAALGVDKDTIPIKAGSASPQPPDNSLVKNPAVPAGQAGGDEEEGQELHPYVASVDVYGSSRINDVVLKETLGHDLDQWLKMGIAGDPRSVEVESKLAAKVKNKFGFAEADWSIVEYFEPGDPAIHITLDVVEKEDQARREPFLKAPTGEFKDPEGLIKAWMEYEDTAIELVESGQLEPEADECVAFHCPFGHVHPKLKKYEKIFVEGVKKHEKELALIQSQDRRPEWRAAATYLLPYLKDGKKVISLMVDRIKDPEVMVRNNALRVLGDIAEFNPEFIIPVKPLLEALEFPRVSDRSKAIYVVYLLALNSKDAREQVLKSSVPTLIQMLGCKQPDHHDIAHGILRKISGKEFAATDASAWKGWYAKLNGERTRTARK